MGKKHQKELLRNAYRQPKEIAKLPRFHFNTSQLV
jgi:hypothetical protein